MRNINSNMTIEQANKIYNILVNLGGASEDMRDSFVYHHIDDKTDKNHEICTEWRFMGKLGYGGKYRSRYNTVDCYKEDETKTTLKLVNEINELLKLV